jgi:hypothetical protein
LNLQDIFALSQSFGSLPWYIERIIQQNIPNIKITQDGVAKLLRNINPSKALGPDNIPNGVLNQCADHLAPALTIIFQRSIYQLWPRQSIRLQVPLA